MNTDFFGTIDRTSYFSNLNAGVKLIVSFTLIIAALIVRDPLTSGILFALELLGFILVGFRPVNVLARFWPILIAVITTGWSVAMLSAKSGTTILDLGFNTITTDSAAVGAAMMIRSLAMVLPTLAFVLTTDPLDEDELAARTNELATRLRLTHLLDANPFTLSGGEKRRLSVASALATAPKILILDEPTFGQDARTWAELVDLIRELLAGGTAIISITHDEDYTAALGGNHITLEATATPGKENA